jgi:thiol-disulfide isomerase/thioredoxin
VRERPAQCRSAARAHKTHSSPLFPPLPLPTPRCGPCRRFAPQYEALAKQHDDAVFLKVCEADSADAMTARGVRAFPTFHLYLTTRKVEEVTGADEAALVAAIEKHKKNAVGPSFAGSGLSLGAGSSIGGGATTRPEDVREARLRRLTGAGAGTASGLGPRGPVKADPDAVKNLVSMGFGEVRARKALTRASPTGRDLEAALEWLLVHQDDADIDTPEAAAEEAGAGEGSAAAAPPAASAAAAASASTSSSSSSASPAPAKQSAAAAASAAADAAEAVAEAERNDLVANPATDSEMAELQAAIDASMDVDGGASSSSSSSSGGGEPPKRLTREELDAKIRSMRAKKAAEAKAAARANEMKRREEGKKSVEMADEILALQRKADNERQKHAKEFDAREKLRIQLELLKDKAERETRTHGKASEETLAKIKALVEGKPLPLDVPPAEQLARLVKAFTFQRVGGAGRAAADVLQKILTNIVASPADPKFRTLKLSSKALQDKVLPAQGGLAFLTAVGFARDDSDAAGGPVLRLDEGAINLDLLKGAVKELDAALTGGAFN